MIDVEEILSKMNPNQKINYDRVMQKMVQVWEKNEERPTILMHVCCAPCSTYTLEYLTKYADVTIYFANSNIIINIFKVMLLIIEIGVVSFINFIIIKKYKEGGKNEDKV